MSPNSVAWIGLLEVEARPGNAMLGAAKGAFVNALALASDAEDFERRVSRCLERFGFRLIEAQDVERLSEWKARNVIHSEIAALEDVLSDENPVQFDEFQAFASF